MRTVYIDIDSLRADHVGVYGYDAPTTPNIDALAADGVHFERTYVAGSPCMPSRASFLTGRYPVHHGVATHGAPAQTVRSPATRNRWFAGWAEDWSGETRNALAEWNGESRHWLTLPELFFHDRTETCAVSSFPRHTAPFFYQLWHHFHQPQEPEGDAEYFQTPRAADVVDQGLDFLADVGDEDCFLYLQLWDPHTPYHRSEEEVARFADIDLPPHPTADQIATHHDWDVSSAAQLGIEDRDDLRQLLATYDAEIRYADAQVGRLLDWLRDRGRYDDTMVVVTGDHGEEFGEQGVYRQHWSAHDGTQHVPLVVKPPADAPVDVGGRDHLVTNVDVAPTLADYAGLEPPGQWQGRSLKPVIEGPVTNDEWRDAVVFDHGLYAAQRAIRTDRWKFIRTYHPGVWADVVPERALYDMSADPWEQENVLETHPEVAAELEDRMAAWVERHRGEDEDPIREVARNGPPAYLAGEEYWGKDISGDAG